MSRGYQSLFGLEVFHSYFQQNICRCLEFNAEADTVKLMKRFRFVIRRKVNGFGLYSDSEQSAEQQFNYIQQATGLDSFSFEIRTTDPDFNFFTELPPDWVGQMNYDSNNASLTDGRVQLNEEPDGTTGDAYIGRIILRFDDILRFSDQTGYPTFAISYQARATQWQYFVINRSSVPLNEPSISGKGDITFDGPQNVVTAAGEAALLFSSGANLLPLSEQVIYKFDLVNLPSSTDGTSGKPLTPRVIIKGLPNPAPQWIGTVKDDTSQLSSPMYVYL